MRRIWQAFTEAFWAAFYQTAKRHSKDPVIQIRIEIDDAQAQHKLDALESRLVQFESRAARIDAWAVRH